MIRLEVRVAGARRAGKSHLLRSIRFLLLDSGYGIAEDSMREGEYRDGPSFEEFSCKLAPRAGVREEIE